MFIFYYFYFNVGRSNVKILNEVKYYSICRWIMVFYIRVIIVFGFFMEFLNCIVFSFCWYKIGIYFFLLILLFYKKDFYYFCILLINIYKYFFWVEIVDLDKDWGRFIGGGVFRGFFWFGRFVFFWDFIFFFCFIFWYF